MKTVFKITFVCLAALACNSVSAQNTLTKRSIKKAEAKSFVKTQPAAIENSVKQEQMNSTIQTQPAPVKQISTTEAKIPAQMSHKPIQKKRLFSRKQ